MIKIVQVLFRWLMGRRYQRSVRHIDKQLRATQEHFFKRLAAHHGNLQVSALQPADIWRDGEAFRQQVKITDYTHYEALIAHQFSAGAAALAFEPKPTPYYGHSSTSRKYIPFTRLQIQCFKHYQNDVLAHMLQACPGIALKTFIVLGGLATETLRPPQGPELLRGYSSAIMMRLGTRMFRNLINPPLPVLLEADLGRKLQLMHAALLESQPRILSGMPEMVKGLLALLLENDDDGRIQSALREIRLVCWSGNYLTAEDAEYFRQTLHPDVVLYDVCSATEGSIGFSRETQGVFGLAAEHGWFLFVDAETDERRFAWELKEHRQYRLALSNFTGLTAYETGDIIDVVQQAPLRFRLRTPRNEYALIKQAMPGHCYDFYLYLAENCLSVYFEGDASGDSSVELIERLKAQFQVDQVKLYSVARLGIAKAAYLASHAGLIKLKRLQTRAELHALYLEQLAPFLLETA